MSERARAFTLAFVAAGLGLVVLVLLLAVPQLVQADIHTVCDDDCDFDSIQAALNAANPGDTIYVQEGSYPEPFIISRSVTLLGGWNTEFTVRTPRTSVIGGGAGAAPLAQIIHPYDGDGGAESAQASAAVQSNFVGSGIEVVIDGFEFTGGNTGGSGGAIYVEVEDDSKVVINDNFIHDNTADNEGGAIWADLDNRCTLEITGNDIMTNTAAGDGGGIYADLVMSGTLTLTGNEIVGNTAASNGGGGFYVLLETYGHFQIEDNVVMSNTVSGPNGGFYLEAYYACQGTFDRNRVEGNEAGGTNGGGTVDLEYNSTTTFDDNQFLGNESVSENGGLYMYLYYNSHVTGDALKLADNEAGSSYGGGSVWLYYGGSATLPNTRITGNKADGDGGGAYLFADNYATIEVPNLYVYDNHALDGSAGGVYFETGDGGETILARDSQFISNTCTSDGGGAYVYGYSGSLMIRALVDLTGSQFKNNRAGTGDDGGGLYVGYVAHRSEVYLDDTEFISNTAGSYGGGLFVEDCYYLSECYLRRATFRGNEAEYGGAIYFYGTDYGSQAYIDDGTFISNTATSAGGALYIEYLTYGGGTFSFSRNEVLSNTAAGDGGAVYVYYAEYGGENYLDDNTFRNNVAGGSGGAFYADDYLAYEGAVVSFSGNTLIGNRAEDGDGGAFCAASGLAYDGGTILINDNWFEDNQAADEGGAFFADESDWSATLDYGSAAQFNGNTVINNTAGEDGGGVYFYSVSYGSSLEFRDNVITGNVISSEYGYNGGGVYFSVLEDGSVVWMTGNQINDNVATGFGGGLFWDSYIGYYGSALYFEDNELQRNRAGEGGGGCYFWSYADEGAAVFFNGNLVNDNVAQGDAGGCSFQDGFLGGNDVDLMGNEFNRNTAGGDYGGLYIGWLDDGTVLRFWDNEVIANRAGISGTQVLGGDAGGLWLELVYFGSEADMRDNQILSNTAYLTDSVGGNYGGFYASLGSSDTPGLLTMKDNLIAGNAAQESYGGLEIDMSDRSRLVMEHNVIADNTAVTKSGGLFIWGEDDSQYYLRRNKIVGNTAGAKGGLWIDNSDTDDPLWGLSENNLVADNEGSGIYLWNADFWSTNDTIANNGDYGILITGTGTISVTAHLSNTIVWGHDESFVNTDLANFAFAADYSDIEGDWPGTGNLNTDPDFVDAAAGDYHLQAGSLLLEQALTAVAPPIDLDGIPRPVPAGGEADMGCYEWFRAEVTLAPDQAKTVQPGSIATYDLTVTNDGNLADSFGLDVPVNDLGWPVSVLPASVDLAAGASAAIQVKVTVPAGTAGGTVNGLTVRATSKSDGTIIGTASLETTAANVAGVGLAPDLAKSGAPGSVVSYEHTLTNAGNFADTITLEATSSQGWATSVLPVAATVPGGASVPVVVHVMVPAGAPAGVVDVTTIKATSSASEGTTEDTAIDTSTVAQVAGVEMGPDNSGTSGPGTTASYSHVVTNTGNGADVFSVTAVSSQGWTVQVVPDTLNLEAGESGSVQVLVTVPQGAGGLVDVTVATATSAYNAAVTDGASDTTTVIEAGAVIRLPIVFKNY